MQRRRRLTAGLLTVLVLGAVTWRVTPAAAFAWADAVAARPLQYGLLLAVATILRPAIAWPPTALSVAVGYGYGPWGLPLALALVVLTSLPPYWFGGHTATEGRVTAAGNQLLAETGSLRGLIGARLLPIPSDLVSVGAGATQVRLRPFLASTAAGELPWAVLGVVAGHSLSRLQQRGLTGKVDPLILIGLTAAGALLLAGPCYRLLERRDALDSLR
ncbi:MAG: hypothetical protein J07HN6_01952 [Halonotius sp. J07HN6]|nr:MAG: hypothetical protein J07HN6_01952 [Halonotius sp. J07HN6]